MLARLTVARRLPQILGVRYSSGSEGSVARSKEFGQRERSQEEQYSRQHDMELLRKLKEQIDKNKAQLDALEKEHAELEEFAKKQQNSK